MKSLIFSLALAVFIAAPFAESRAQVTVKMGGTVWYNRWQPAWLDDKIDRYQTSKFKNIHYVYWDGSHFKPQQMPLYGPVLGLTFLKTITVSWVFVYGRVTFKTMGPSFRYNISTSFNNEPSFKETRYVRKIKKMDSDLTLSWHITESFSIYAGYKYQAYDYKQRFDSVTLDPDPANFDYGTYPRGKKVNKASGGGLGVGYNLRLVDDFFLQPSISGVLLAGKDRFSNELFIHPISTLLGYAFPRKGHYLMYGGTGSLTFAYVIHSDLSLSAGFRCQALKYHQHRTYRAYELLNGRYDLFYGLTFSAVYGVTFGG
ncbi:MAG TPA: hypothetical protein PK573_11835 [Spirochaetota bacterium]|nr:hypothetical protein [Spirochaetota bacterium]